MVATKEEKKAEKHKAALAAQEQVLDQMFPLRIAESQERERAAEKAKIIRKRNEEWEKNPPVCPFSLLPDAEKKRYRGGSIKP